MKVTRSVTTTPGDPALSLGFPRGDVTMRSYTLEKDDYPSRLPRSRARSEASSAWSTRTPYCTTSPPDRLRERRRRLDADLGTGQSRLTEATKTMEALLQL